MAEVLDNKRVWRRVLAVDTSSLVQSVALVDYASEVSRRVVLSERTARNKKGHASGLLSAIDAALELGGVSAPELDLLVIGEGPGSFTGLRIGLASLKSIAWVHSLPLIPASSLAALARGVGGQRGLVAPIVDARKGQLYAGLYALEDGPAALMDDAAFDPDGLVEALAARAGQAPLVLVGDGLRKYGQRLQSGLEARGVKVRLSDPSYWIVRAAHLAVIGADAASRHELPALATLEPNYQRASEAEIKFGARGG